jgi:hypothetical protein
MTVDGCGGPAVGAFGKEAAWFAPYIEPGRPPCAGGGKYDPPGVAEGGGGAALLYGCC